jgi:hypothetical protein
MGAGGRDHYRAIGEFLTAHVGEIDVVSIELGRQIFQAHDHRLGRTLSYVLIATHRSMARAWLLQELRGHEPA